MILLKHPFPTISLILLSFIFLINCESREDLQPNPIELGCGTDHTDSVSTLTATIDGELFCPSSVEVYNRSIGAAFETYVMTARIGVEDGKSVGEYVTILKIDIHIGPDVETGTFSVSENKIVASVSKVHSTTEDYVYAYHCSGKYAELSSGTITIEKSTGGFIKGTFEFEMIPDVIIDELDGDGSNIFITDGKFNIQVKK